ncbi:DUF3231 family protein [Paenibacillus sp. HWE-109]|uniref:DUF3231 family protein n=1 Tax=Paenibacillus sp. HWE-109 TaxID=1306526 RepID=UPI001EDED8C7|nr:DUF3231 family protein [Paenibacillus sp. HWE-109]UKS25478.1 DUF3231 family protein [Paenibacillus sp. HWE-109]
MDVKNPISSAELGTLWLTYQQKTLILRVLEYFIEKTEDSEARNIMGGLWQDLSYYVNKIKDLFELQGIVIPVGFGKEDVHLDAPKLYDNGFDIMFLRVLKEISMGLYTVNMNMSYRSEVMDIYEGLTVVTQKTYRRSTEYLLKKGILTIPPKVTMPQSTEFIESKSYLKGFNLWGDKRALNTIELGVLHHGIETNNVGMQVITGFAQCASNPEVKDYFVKGKELAKKQIQTFEGILLENDIQFSATSGCTVTTSTLPPFSDKLMMFCVYLLNGFGLVSSSFGTVFTLRNDVTLKTAWIAKDIYFYTHDGIKIMIKNGWLEEPPQMEDRHQLIHH